jgi:hypothetical protein
MVDTKRLMDCETGQYPGRTGDADWARFCRAAHAAGYPSGQSCANEMSLWDRTVDDAIRFCQEQEVSDG